MTYTPETKSLYYSEVATNLRREGFEVEKLSEEHLAVSLDAQPICKVSRIGGITYRSETLSPLIWKVKRTVPLRSSAAPQSMCVKCKSQSL